ncbi:hypothetical protein [uncultured Jatrophihabitans sp.]|uniref:hypothetical protein n=1 Tax=uncultured Jatrophihabitans sp. TaxID=1610747 RepID=UPI0035CBBF37
MLVAGLSGGRRPGVLGQHSGLLTVRTLCGFLAALTLLAACSSAPSKSQALKVLGSGQVGASFPHTVAGPDYDVVIRAICTRGAPVTITKVAAAKPSGGIKVVTWGVRPPRDGAIMVPDHGAVSQMPGFGQNPVAVKCGSRIPDQFAISVSKAARVASMSGVWLHTDAGKVFSQFRFKLTP